MKNILIKIIPIIFIFTGIISCRSQQIVPLNTGWYTSSTGTYFKDINNELDQFVGTWTANYANNNTITLIITKELQKQFQDIDKVFYRDMLRVRYQVIAGGLIVHSTLNNNFTLSKDYEFLSLFTKPANNEVILMQNGGRCSVGLGTVYFKKINTNQFQWNYRVQPATINSESCPPPYDNDKVFLPTVENLIFTKQ